MAVTVTWREWNAAETPGNFIGTAVTSINFGSTDAANLTPATYPITAGNNSYAKYLKVNFSGSYTKISNAKLYKSAGAYVTGETVQFSGSVTKTASAPTASDAGWPTISATAPASANLILAGGTTGGTLPRATDVRMPANYYSGSRSNVLGFQSKTTVSSPAGAVNQKTITLTYDRQ